MINAMISLFELVGEKLQLPTMEGSPLIGDPSPSQSPLHA